MITKPVAIAIAALGVLLLVAGLRNCGDDRIAPPTVTVADTIENAVLRARLAAYQHDYGRVMVEAAGLRGTVQQLQNRIRGLEARRPDTVLVAADPVDVRRDTLARPTITVRGGIATYAVLVPRVDSLHEERLLTGIDVRDCDDGYVLGPEGAACNSATLGHLTLLARVRVSSPAAALTLTRPPPGLEPSGELALSWRRCFRCTFGVEVALSTRREVIATVQTGVRIF